MKPKIFLSAGDPSGDNAGARLFEELFKIYPDLVFSGLGGERLKNLGQRQFVDGRELAVLGFWEVAKKFLFFRDLMNRAIADIKKERPDCIILIDYPGFNLRLAARIKDLGIPIIYYISPQVWAWGKKRIVRIKSLVDLMLVILPFEEDFYNQHDVTVKYPGHYLLEDIPSEFISSPIPGHNILALLPGSRRQEIERMFPVMLETGAALQAKHGMEVVVAGIKDAYDYEYWINKYKNSNIRLEYNRAREVVAESDLVLTASGTATLETGIIGRPMVIVYKTGFLTYQIARRLVEIDKIGLVNWVLGEVVVPELVQNDVTPTRIMAAFDTIRNNTVEIKRRLDTLPELLGGEGASQRSAAYIAEILGSVK